MTPLIFWSNIVDCPLQLSFVIYNPDNAFLPVVTYSTSWLPVVLCTRRHDAGTPNDGFLLNTLNFQSHFRSAEMHSKRLYKICICLVITCVFSTRASVLVFPKSLDAVKRITKVKILLIPLDITFLNPNILSFLFSSKNIG